MALTCAIRRASSRVVPLALRASAGTQRYFHHHRDTALLATVRQAPRNTLHKSLFPAFMNHYSSKPSSDAALLRVINTEIECAMESQEGEEAEAVPEGFPFEIEDNPGQQTLTLRKEYQGETITVEVHMASLVSGEDNDNDNDNDNDDDNDDDNKEEDNRNHSSLPMVVRVSKNDGPCLEFGVTAYPDDIEIDSLSIKNPENSGEEIAYEGPDFQDLDENLQKAFSKYLEIRGIRVSTTNFLHGYMIDKDGKEYIAWLKKLQKFVQA